MWNLLERENLTTQTSRCGELWATKITDARESEWIFLDGRIRQVPNHIKIHVPNFWIYSIWFDCTSPILTRFWSHKNPCTQLLDFNVTSFRQGGWRILPRRHGREAAARRRKEQKWGLDQRRRFMERHSYQLFVVPQPYETIAFRGAKPSPGLGMSKVAHANFGTCWKLQKRRRLVWYRHQLW